MFRFPESRPDRWRLLAQAVLAGTFIAFAIRNAHGGRWVLALFDVAVLGSCALAVWDLCRRPSGGAR